MVRNQYSTDLNWSGYTSQEAAESAARVMSLLGWKTASPGGWLRVVEKAAKLFRAKEGAKFEEISQELRRTFWEGEPPTEAEPGPHSGAEDGLRWNMVTRHLACIYDAGVVDDLEFVEAGWVDIMHDRAEAYFRNYESEKGGVKADG